MKKQATIYDFRQLCQAYWNNCQNCPMWKEKCSLSIMSDTEVDRANEIILKWCRKHSLSPWKIEFLKNLVKGKEK